MSGKSPNAILSTNTAINDGFELAANEQCVVANFPNSFQSTQCNSLSSGKSPNAIVSTNTLINDGFELAANEQCVVSGFPNSFQSTQCNSLSGR